MYGGLFGDLPSAKKQKINTSASNDAAKTTGPNDKNKSTNDSSSPPSSTGDKGAAKTKTLAAPTAKGNWFAPPRQAAAKAKDNKSQFLQMVGKSGTTMAFVPSAALKSKRKKIDVADNATNKNKKTTNAATEKNGETTKKSVSKANSTEQQSSFAAVTTTTTTTRVAASNPDKMKPAVVVDIHGTGNSVGGTGDSNPAPAADAVSRQIAASETTTDEEKITDPYDPYVPNDLLEYWETLAAKKHREKLERDTLEALEKQRFMRKQLEEDRKAMLQQATVGGAPPPRSLGRGRGVSNLPAWLVEKQRASESVVVGAVGDDAPSFRGRGRGVSNLPAWLVEKQRKEASNEQ